MAVQRRENKAGGLFQYPVRCLDEGLAHYRASEMTRRTNTGSRSHNSA